MNKLLFMIMFLIFLSTPLYAGKARPSGFYLDAAIMYAKQGDTEVKINNSLAWGRPVFAKVALNYRHYLSNEHYIYAGLMHISNTEVWEGNFDAAEIGVSVKLY